MYYWITPSPVGDILMTADDIGLTALAFQSGNAAIEVDQTYQKDESKFKEAIKQLEEYFAGLRTDFDLPLNPVGTAFQKSVWQTLCEIPFGESKSYQCLANELNNPKAVRAVGSANGKNPIALIVPCHRVIGSNKKLTGYAGGLELKAKLLTHEGIEFSR